MVSIGTMLASFVQASNVSELSLARMNHAESVRKLAILYFDCSDNLNVN